MELVFPSELSVVWQCPCCDGGALLVDSGIIRCTQCHTAFPTAGHRPILMCPDNELFYAAGYGSGECEPAPPSSRPYSRWAQRLLQSVNLSQDRCVADMTHRLGRRATVLLLGGGRQRARLQELMGPTVTIIAIDVDAKADVDVFADAHALPFKDLAFDGVIATAVLEHVLRPERVMEEIGRVMRPGGFLYSEIPFMQQVHEGAYDFTRYTLSGHLRLAAAFSEIECGAVAGPATALLWSVEYLLLALGGSRWPKATKLMVRVALGWLAPLDRRIADRPAALDGASCTYFYGQRRLNQETSDRWIIDRYPGAQAVHHQ